MTGIEAIRAWLTSDTILSGLMNLITLTFILLIIYLLTVLVIQLTARKQERDRVRTPLEAAQEADLGIRQGIPKPTGETCYVDMVISYGSAMVQRREKVSKSFTIGSARCSLLLDASDPGLAKRHCELFFAGGILYIRDLSGMGLRVNETPVRDGCVPVRSGDQVMIGRHVLRLSY